MSFQQFLRNKIEAHRWCGYSDGFKIHALQDMLLESAAQIDRLEKEIESLKNKLNEKR